MFFLGFNIIISNLKLANSIEYCFFFFSLVMLCFLFLEYFQVNPWHAQYKKLILYPNDLNTSIIFFSNIKYKILPSLFDPNLIFN